MAPLKTVVFVTVMCGALPALVPVPAGAQATEGEPAGVRTATPAQRLAQLAERYYEELARFEPLNATFFGDNRFDDLLPMTIVPAVRARQFAMLHGVQEE